jgi:adenylylsulfate kinase
MTGAVVWLTGLPASGKSTLAARVANRLREAGVATALLDGDEVRDALVPAPGHDPDACDGFYRTLAALAALLARQGLVTIVPATAHRRAWRELARSLVARFIEVHVDTPLDECRRRDRKGLYAHVPALPDLPGPGVDYQPPRAPDVVAAGGDDRDAVARIVAMLGVGRDSH